LCGNQLLRFFGAGNDKAAHDLCDGVANGAFDKDARGFIALGPFNDIDSQPGAQYNTQRILEAVPLYYGRPQGIAPTAVNIILARM
jgi:hypothetical protein